MFRVTIADVTDVDFFQSAKIPRAVVLAIGYTATDAAVDFTSIFVHHSKKPPLKVRVVCVSCSKIIDICKKIL